MADNNFRIAGAMGLTTDPTDSNTQETILQGLGFPLRPIDNTAPTTQGPIDNNLLAIGQPMQWMGNWNGGKLYPRGAFVIDGLWSSVAIANTLEKPAPTPDPLDPESYGIPAFIPTTQVQTSSVVTQQTYTFSQSGWIKELRVWVTEISPTTDYRIVIDNFSQPGNPVNSIIENPVLVANGWSVVAQINEVVQAGAVIRIQLDALNSGATSNISGGWIYQGPTQSGAPLLQNWSQDNQRSNFRINKTDLDGTDRSTELQGVVNDSVITLNQTDNVGNSASYRVSAVIDQGTYMFYEVTLQAETGGGPDIGSTTSIDIDIPIPLPTEYAQELLVWNTLPSWASSVEGALKFENVDQGVPITNAYGVDILFEPALVSEDWEIVSYNG